MKYFLRNLFNLGLAAHFVFLGNLSASELTAPSDVCDRILNLGLRGECNVFVKRNSFTSQTAIDVCDGFENADWTFACIRLIANKSYQKAPVDECATYRGPDNLKYNCLSIVGNRQFNVSAVNACHRNISLADTNSCLAAIANKTYDKDEVEACDAYSDSYSMIGCFKRLGRR